MARTITLIVSVLLAGSAFSQQALLLDRRSAFVNAVSGPGCTVTTNAITINLLTAFGDTSNNSFYASASVTPSAAGATIIAFISNTPNVATNTVTNTGATQLSWYYAGITQTNNYAGTNWNTTTTPTARLEAFITQLPPGVAPFAMRVVPQDMGSGTGCLLAVVEALGCDTNVVWGQNAIHQVAMSASNATVHPRIDWGAPGNNGSNTIIYALADDINSNTNRTQKAGWTVVSSSTNTYATPANFMGIYYKNYVPASETFTTNTAASRDWAMLALELRAGTNACGYEDPLAIPLASTRTKYFYVDTASETAGGTGLVTNQVSGTDRAFKWLRDGLESTPVRVFLAAGSNVVIWCKGATNDTNICLQTTWNNIDTFGTNRLYIVGDNTTGTNNPATYKWATTNNNFCYNNSTEDIPGTSAHVWIYNVWCILHGTTSGGANTYTCFRLTTQNVGTGRTDCDCRFINCGAVMTASGTDDVIGFLDSDYTVNDARNRCKRINCLAYGGTYGFNAADAGPFMVENYNCTAVSNEFNFIDVQLLVNCLGAYPRVGNSFESTYYGQGFSGWNSTTDTSLGRHSKMSRISQTPTFIGGFSFLLQTSDTSSKNVGFGDPLSGVFRFDGENQTRSSSAVLGVWDIGYDEFQ